MTTNSINRLFKFPCLRFLRIGVFSGILFAAVAGCEFEYSIEGSTTVNAQTSPTQTAAAPTSGNVRVMTYNIQYLNTEAGTHGNRIQKLQKIIDQINPAVVGIQEVADRAAMELVFPKTDWQIVIDDDSRDKQDLAFAVRRPWELQGISEDLDADDENFLAEEQRHESFFPNRRDALFLNIQSPDGATRFTVVNIHAKARVGGRAKTDHRREGAARVLVDTFKTKLKGRNVILIGDFNDAPDDTSLNILETGNATAAAGANAAPGAFMINLSQPLWEQNMVTHGANIHRLDRDSGLINNIYPEARRRNNNSRGRDAGSGPILFDQILISRGMSKAVEPNAAATIYLDPIALTGPGFSRPSDHLPVYADIDFSKLR